MKKWMAVFLIAALLCGCAADGGSNLIPEPTLTAEDLVGKTLAEVEAVVDFDYEMLAYGHGFAADKAGNPIYFTCEWNGKDEYVITSAEIFAAKDTDNSPESFDKLQEGMTISEVMSTVGMPSSIPATGVFYIAFTDSNGDEYWLAWQNDPLTLSWIVEPAAE